MKSFWKDNPKITIFKRKIKENHYQSTSYDPGKLFTTEIHFKKNFFL